MQAPDSIDDFEADANAVERENRRLEQLADASAAGMYTNDEEAFADDPVFEGDSARDRSLEAEELALKRQQLELQMQELEARRATVERRRTTPQVIDSAGELVEDARPAAPTDPVWKGLTIEIQGKTVQIKQPSAAMIRYLGIFALGTHGSKKGDFTDFMTRHVTPKSIDDIRAWTYAEEIDEHFYDDLVKRLVTEGTNRPTVPSSASRRSR